MTVTHEEGPRFKIDAPNHTGYADQPASRGGTGKGMTPPEHCVAGLAACVGVYVRDFAAARNIPHEGFRVEAEWERADNPARIGKILIRLYMPSEVPERYRQPLIRAAEQCLVHNTLRMAPQVSIALAEG
jgi:putative redox protein